MPALPARTRSLPTGRQVGPPPTGGCGIYDQYKKETIMIDQDDIKELFQDKYEGLMGLSYDEWLEVGPQTEDEAYARLQEIDTLLKEGYDEWFEAEEPQKSEIEDYRDKLKAEYDLLEEIYGLELNDR